MMLHNFILSLALTQPGSDYVTPMPPSIYRAVSKQIDIFEKVLHHRACKKTQANLKFFHPSHGTFLSGYQK